MFLLDRPRQHDDLARRAGAARARNPVSVALPRGRLACSSLRSRPIFDPQTARDGIRRRAFAPERAGKAARPAPRPRAHGLAERARKREQHRTPCEPARACFRSRTRLRAGVDNKRLRTREQRLDFPLAGEGAPHRARSSRAAGVSRTARGVVRPSAASAGMRAQRAGFPRRGRALRVLPLARTRRIEIPGDPRAHVWYAAQA